MLRLLASLSAVLGLIALIAWYEVNTPISFIAIFFIACGVGGLIWEKLGKSGD